MSEMDEHVHDRQIRNVMEQSRNGGQAPAPEEFVIRADLAVSILNYLASKPFNEVVGLIQGLQQLDPVTTP